VQERIGNIGIGNNSLNRTPMAQKPREGLTNRTI
jgi:hypothetical protein